MACSSASKIVSVLGLTAVSALLLAPDLARACDLEPQCASYRSVELSNTALTSDGAVLWHATRSRQEGANENDVLAATTLEAFDDDGTAVAGSLELAYRGARTDVFAWRPDEPLTTGTSLSISLSIDNDALEECDQPIDETYDVQVIDGQAQAPSLPDLSFETTYSIRQDYEIDDLLCCDGAYPAVAQGSCEGETVGWSEGSCTGSQGTGVALGTFQVGALAADAAGHTMIELRIDGVAVAATPGFADESISLHSDNSQTVQQMTIAIVNVLDGTVLESDPFTNDGGDPDALGPIDIDIDAFAAQCEEEPYVCEQLEDARGYWDPMACAPSNNPGQVEPAEEGGGCSIALDEPAWSSWLLLLALGLRTRRRRNA